EIDVPAVCERRQRPQAVAAARILEFDDLGAEISEEKRGVRARQQAREVEHAHAGERLHASRYDVSRACARSFGSRASCAIETKTRGPPRSTVIEWRHAPTSVSR